MKRKLGSIIYVCCVIGIIAGISIWIIANNDSIDVTDPPTYVSQTGKEDETTDKEDEERLKKILEEIQEAEKNAIYHRGEYPNCSDSRELNTSFISNGYKLNDPIAGYEIEFVGYKELSDISDYIGKKGIMSQEYAYYINDNILNDDGTLNNISFKYKERINDGVYGKEFVIDNYELIAIQLKFKLKNTKNIINEIDTSNFLTTESFIYMDDGKLYRNSSIYYYYNLNTTTYTYPIYHSFMNKVLTPDGVYPTVITLAPMEAIEGELIYILGKKDLQDIYLVANANNTNIENFNGKYITFLPLKNLMDISN